jgi:hypothetical protein
MMAAGCGYADRPHPAVARRRRAAISGKGETAVELAARGVFDIDRMTWGACQADTVRVLLQAAPDVRPRSAANCR